MPVSMSLPESVTAAAPHSWLQAASGTFSLERAKQAAVALKGQHDLDTLYEAICRDAADSTGAHRAGLWFFDAAGNLVCRRRYYRQSGLFDEGPMLRADQKARFLDTLRRDRLLVAADARQMPALADLMADFLEPFGVVSLLALAIPSRDGPIPGALILEDGPQRRDWRQGDVLAACDLAEILAVTTLRLAIANPAADLYRKLPFADQPLLAEAAIAWIVKQPYDGLPRSADLLPSGLTPALRDHVLIADLRHDPFGVHFSYAGSAYGERFGVDLTGQDFADYSSGEHRAWVEWLYRTVWEKAAPLYSESKFRFRDRAMMARRLMLPLADASGKVEKILVVHVWPEEQRASAAPWLRFIDPHAIEANISQLVKFGAFGVEIGQTTSGGASL